MSEPSFFALQRAFTRYLRDPDNIPAPRDLDPGGLAVYKYAVIANAEVFMSDNFPRTKAVMSAPDWAAMVRDYYTRHASYASLFVDLPAEFLKYLEALRDDPNDPPFILELAHFENLENVVSTDERRIDETVADRTGDVLTGVPLVNPTTQLARYTFPVHTIDADYQFLEVPQTPTFIVAFRDRSNRFGFIDVNAPTARIVELLLSDQNYTGEQILTNIASELQHADVKVVIEGGKSILDRLVTRDVILGTRC